MFSGVVHAFRDDQRIIMRYETVSVRVTGGMGIDEQKPNSKNHYRSRGDQQRRKQQFDSVVEEARIGTQQFPMYFALAIFLHAPTFLLHTGTIATSSWTNWSVRAAIRYLSNLMNIYSHLRIHTRYDLMGCLSKRWRCA